MELNKLADDIHQECTEKGWWGERQNPLVVSNKLALIISEVCEALEADRKNSMDDHLPHRLGVEVELADAVIRILDLVGCLRLDLDGAIQEKLEYNRVRFDHTAEARAQGQGKRY